MKIIKPDELANVCTLFYTLNVKKILLPELSSLVTSSLSIDSFYNSSEIIQEAIELGLLELRNKYYYITSLGFKLAKLHSNMRPFISDSAKDYMLKNIYLNREINESNVDKFISKFYPDTEYNTFICERGKFTSSSDIKNTLIFQSLGLIDYKDDKVFINSEYIGLINNFLLLIRNKNNKEFIESPLKKIIGEITETIAYEYEKQRLINSGHPELANLVQKISNIDYSAGYDINSFLGTGQNFIKPIFIEVKGTEKDYVFFYWTKNEQSVSIKKKDDYYLYIYTNVDIKLRQAIGPKIICDPINCLHKTGYIIEAQDLIVKEK